MIKQTGTDMGALTWERLFIWINTINSNTLLVWMQTYYGLRYVSSRSPPYSPIG